MEQQADIYEDLMPLIQQKLKENGMNKKELAERLNLHPSSVYKFLEGKNMPLDRLETLSVILDFNFFRDLSIRLSMEQPLTAEGQRIQELEIANKTLKELIKS
jgi:predicted transcriptional regulator